MREVDRNEIRNWEKIFYKKLKTKRKTKWKKK